MLSMAVERKDHELLFLLEKGEKGEGLAMVVSEAIVQLWPHTEPQNWKNRIYFPERCQLL